MRPGNSTFTGLTRFTLPPVAIGGRVCTVSAQREKERIMFQYIPKSVWFPTSVDIKQAPTIEALEKLCKDGEVERVIIPFTYYGYGASLIDDSNKRSIEKHYAANRFKTYGYSLTMSSYQFLKHSDFRELIEELQETNPIFNEQDYSELETETELEFLVDEIETLLFKEDATLPNGKYWEKEDIREALESGEADNRIEWWEFVEIDGDGATPYATEDDVKFLAELVKEKGKSAN
jgi:hypothetical protein